MTLREIIAPKPEPARLQQDLAAAREVKGTTDILRMQLLPSEEAVFERFAAAATREVAVLAAEARWLGRLDLPALLAQQRPGPAPRWFLYHALRPCDTVCWSTERRVTFEMWRGGRKTEAIRVDAPNPFGPRALFKTEPILLPARIREQVRALAVQRVEPYILFEPRLVRSELLPEPQPIVHPDPALIVQAGGEWFVVDVWDDPAVEDPRALNGLREFYVRVQYPAWWQPPKA